MNKAKIITLLLITSFLLAGCSLPGQSVEPTADIVATQVAQMLTGSATEQDAPPTETVAPPPTETVEVEEPTLTPTVTLTPTLTPGADDPAQRLGDPAWTSDFNGSDSAWDFEADQATFATANGFLNLTAKKNANWHSWYMSSPKLKNAYVESMIQLSNCSGNDRFGLGVRSSSDGQEFYFMGITCEGKWGFFRMAKDVNINQIVGFQTADQLSNGTNNPHRVGIWMEGSEFTFYIDGEKVGTANDATLSSDGFTGFLIAFANTPGFTVKVDELKYWNVP